MQGLGTKVQEYQAEVERLLNERRGLKGRIAELEEIVKVGKDQHRVEQLTTRLDQVLDKKLANMKRHKELGNWSTS